MSYAICFDFPETPGEPMFAGVIAPRTGLVDRVEDASRFATEDHALMVLQNYYASEVRLCGRVVEVSA